MSDKDPEKTKHKPSRIWIPLGVFVAILGFLWTVYVHAKKGRQEVRRLLKKAELTLGGEGIGITLEPCPHFVSAETREKVREAKAVLAEALDRRPYRAETLTLLGISHGLLCEDDAALANLERATALKPHHARAHRGICVVLLRQRKFEESVSPCEEAVAQNDEDAYSWLNVGIAYRHTERYAEWLDACQKAVELKPALPDAHACVGTAHHQANNLQDAIDAYRTWSELAPHDFDAKFSLGIALRELGYKSVQADHLNDLCNDADLTNSPELREAVGFFQAIVDKNWATEETNHELEDSFTLLALTLSDLGRDDEARQTLDRGIGIIRNEESVANLRFARAVVSIRNGDKPEGISTLTRMAVDRPDLTFVQECIARLSGTTETARQPQAMPV